MGDQKPIVNTRSYGHSGKGEKFVSAGQMIARMDADTLRNALREAEIGLK